MDSSSDRGRSPTFFGHAASAIRYMTTAIILLLLAVSAFSMIIWMAFHLRDPKFRVKSFTVTNFTRSDSKKVAADFELRLAVINPNLKTDVYFRDLNVSITNQKLEVISRGLIQPFTLKKKGRAEKVLNMERNLRTCCKRGKLDLAPELLGVNVTGKEVELGVKVFGNCRFKAGKWADELRFVRVECKTLKVAFTDEFNAALKDVEGVDCVTSLLKI